MTSPAVPPALPPLDPAAPVSVILTVLNEQQHLEAAVSSALANGYGPGVEVVVAVGPSSDQTAQIAERLAADTRVTVVPNPTGATPQGLNLALAASRRDVVVRIDGHTELPPGYIAHAVAALAASGAANVGGQMVPEGDSPLQRAVAWAMGSRWGIGGARFHVGGDAGPAESVFLGVFRRAAIESLGGFDERFARAQDWELNFRLRAAGYTVWFDPALRVAYRPRASLCEVARQFFSSGRWRREVARTHAGTLSLRYLAPPTLVVLIVLGACSGIAGLLGAPAWLGLGWLAPAAYVAGVAAVALAFVRRLGVESAARLPGVLAAMHLSWGLGFLRGMR